MLGGTPWNEYAPSQMLAPFEVQHWHEWNSIDDQKNSFPALFTAPVSCPLTHARGGSLEKINGSRPG